MRLVNEYKKRINELVYDDRSRKTRLQRSFHHNTKNDISCLLKGLELIFVRLSSMRWSEFDVIYSYETRTSRNCTDSDRKSLLHVL